MLGLSLLFPVLQHSLLFVLLNLPPLLLCSWFDLHDSFGVQVAKVPKGEKKICPDCFQCIFNFNFYDRMDPLSWNVDQMPSPPHCTQTHINAPSRACVIFPPHFFVCHLSPALRFTSLLFCQPLSAFTFPPLSVMSPLFFIFIPPCITSRSDQYTNDLYRIKICFCLHIKSSAPVIFMYSICR